MAEHDGRLKVGGGRRRTATMTDSKSLAVLTRSEKGLEEEETKEHDCWRPRQLANASRGLDRIADSLRLRKHGRTRFKRV